MYWTILLSDHFPISISIGIPPTRTSTTPLHFNFRKATKLHWSEFTKELSDFSFNNAPTSVSSPLEKYDYLSSSILQAASTLSNKLNPNPRSSSHKHPPPPPWWNDECAAANEERKKGLQGFRRDPNTYQNLISIERNAKRIFQKHKLASFKEFCSNLNPFTSTSNLWNTVKRFRHRAFAAEAAPSNVRTVEIHRELIPTICPPPPRAFSLTFLPPSTLPLKH